MKIGILGTRGIPNLYGGFEECAQQLGSHLVKMGHSVAVYSSHRHPYVNKSFKGIEIIHKYDPEHRIGTVGQFFYDLNCTIDCHRRSFDVILVLGYTSSSIWQGLLPKKSLVITNMDGLEWKRSKYSPMVQRFLLQAESWAAKRSDLLIADSQEIKKYLDNKYSTESVYVSYGAKIFKNGDDEILKAYNVERGEYHLIIARLEPENNIDTLLKGIQKSESQRVTLVVGNHETEYGEYLKNTFKDNRIRFVRGTYKKEKINNLRYFSHLYLHGHSVGGTNPGLLEAMASSCLIVSHDNNFNREVLGDNASYFNDEIDVANAIDHLERGNRQKEQIKNNLLSIKDHYNWRLIAEEYEVVFQQALIGRRS
jgi:glycosyltransferase involved in cell wall biosynthesis